MINKTKILIVDDEPVVRLAYSRILASDHSLVEAVSNGVDALERLAEQAFDVVLLDLRMPGMDGMAVLQAIKQNWPDVEVIIITGYAGIDTVKQSVALGAFDYLAKPVGPDDVMNVTNSALRHKGWALRRLAGPQARPECRCQA
ncbi:MAG: response regulator [Burkholderiales bacterium]|nr:response regulator [Burkholderiales bacterium]